MFGIANQSIVNESLSPTDYVTDRGMFYLFWNCLKTAGLPVLIGVMAGDAARAAETMNDQVLVDMATDRLAKVFKLPTRPVPKEAIVTRWRRDRFARGSYSYMSIDSLPGDYDAMAARVGNLFFAGEATCGSHPATVHGAYLSGLRAASEVVEAMFGPIPTPVIG
jgi:monoamine oxidase